MSDTSTARYDYSQTPSNIPIPDPSLITSRAILETKAELRKEFADALASRAELSAVLAAANHEKSLLRIAAVEKEHTTFKEDLQRVPTQLDREIARLQVLFDEKLRSLDVKMDLIASATDKQRLNAEDAIQAAFLAAEKVSNSQRSAFESQISKSESSFTKEIDSLKALLTATRDAITADVANLKGRIDRGEGGHTGAREAVSDRQANSGVIIGFIGGAVGVIGLIAALIFGILNISSANRTASVVASVPSPLAIETAKRVDEIYNQKTRSLPP